MDNYHPHALYQPCTSNTPTLQQLPDLEKYEHPKITYNRNTLNFHTSFVQVHGHYSMNMTT